MTLIQRIYDRLLRVTSKPGERGEYSGGYWQDKTRQAALRVISHDEGRLLEVGCGEGFFLTELAALNSRLQLWGLDRWPQILEKARQRLLAHRLNNITLVQSEAYHLPFEDGFFDVLVCINVLICLPRTEDLGRIVKEFSRVLKPGGKLVVEFRNGRNLILRAKYRLARYYDATVADHPLSTYKEEEVLALLESSGFSVGQKLYLDFPVKRWAPIIIFEAEKTC